MSTVTVAEAGQLYQNDLSIGQVAAELGVSISTAHYHSKKSGVEIRHKPDVDAERARRVALGGGQEALRIWRSVTEIATLLGSVAPATTYNWLSSLGVPLRPRGD